MTVKIFKNKVKAVSKMTNNKKMKIFKKIKILMINNNKMTVKDFNSRKMMKEKIFRISNKMKRKNKQKCNNNKNKTFKMMKIKISNKK